MLKKMLISLLFWNILHASDSLSLVSVYNSNPEKLSWDLSQPYSTWEGVKTDSAGNVTGLDFYYKMLDTIPPAIGDLTYLQELSLISNNIRTVPNGIGRLKNLKVLYLTNNKIKELPSAIGDLKNLTSLDISGNEISSLPEEIEKLDSLKTLKVSNNKLTNLWQNPGKLKNIESLIAKNNNISKWPAVLDSLVKLKQVNLGDNYIDSIPAGIANLTNLEEIYFYSNKLRYVSENIVLLTKIKILDFHNNELEYFPDSINHFRYLERINFSHNRLKKIPSGISFLNRLTDVNFEYNNITDVPKFSYAMYLKKLRLNNNNIDSLPEPLGSMARLSSLYLDSNNLEKLPPSVGYLPQLGVLSVAHNKLDSLPGSLQSLKSLSSLDVRNNRLNFLDLEIANNLAEMFLYNPQDSIGRTDTVFLTEDSVIISAKCRGNFLSYFWTVNGDTLKSNDSSVTVNKEGAYYCDIKSPLFDDIILHHKPVIVKKSSAIWSKKIKKAINNIKIVPNPAGINDNVTILLKNKSNGNAVVTLVDNVGNMVFKKNLTVKNGNIFFCPKIPHKTKDVFVINIKIIYYNGETEEFSQYLTIY